MYAQHSYGEVDSSNECEIRTHCALKENNTTPHYSARSDFSDEL